MTASRPDIAFFEDAGHPTAFAAATIEAADVLARQDVDAGLPHVGVAVCIDAAETQDADDGFRLRVRSDGSVELDVYVTHPVALLALDGVVEQEARLRGASVYTPWGDVPMVPDVLSADRLSLREGTRREALLARGRYAEDGRLIAFDVRLGAVRVAANLAYDAAEALLEPESHADEGRAAATLARCEGEVDWPAARRWTLVRRRWREAHGAINSDLSSVRARVEGDGLTLRRRQRDQWAHRLVAELNIACNEIIALACERDGIWCPWRVQEGVDVSDIVGRWRHHPDDDLRRYMLSRTGRRTETRFVPGPHEGLGVERYAQASSPLRRHADLLLHHAIAAHEAGTPLDAAQLAARLDVSEAAARRSRSVMANVQRYWLLRWFAEQGDRVLEGVFVEPGRGSRATVLLRETLSTIRVDVRGVMEVGASVGIQVTRVHPEKLILEGRCVETGGLGLT